ncbi:ATP-binding protein [Patescibacteria group bacterium]|nr:ATP-binding protein [Patescibacteria group bacterium]MDE1940866.1 ATP-binding protein [Patescibacteria group bacterium]
MIIKRALQRTIETWLFKGKVIILYGPRQVGKTTLAKEIIKKYGDSHSYIDCEIIDNKTALEDRNPERLKKFLGPGNFFILDEAQKISDIGTTLKLLVDTYPDIQIIATGSSSFDLSNKVNEPLTGRAIEFTLYPISYAELAATSSEREAKASLAHLLRFGAYPALFGKSEHEMTVLLQTLTGQYLYKDLFDYEDIRKPDLLLKLLQLLAFQVGSEVSLHEIATKLEVSTKVVSRYLDLLEKAFVIFRLTALSRNPRNEIGKKQKIYFYDLGIRNSLIQRLLPLDIRDDVGPLWENFCIVERRKKMDYAQSYANRYFWRSLSGSEIDYVEEAEGAVHGFEFKWSPSAYRRPKRFVDTYKADVTIVTRDDFESFVS